MDGKDFRRRLKGICWLGAIAMALWSSCSEKTLYTESADGRLLRMEGKREETLAPHPRLFLGKGQEAAVRAMLSEPEYRKVHNRIIALSEAMLPLPLLERTLEGRRLLAVSREGLKRIFYWSYAYRFTGEARYLQRAEEEMLAVCAFSDWNPSHFLDVAEMTLGVAIGYDWLYESLSASTRTTIRQAILTKSLYPSTETRYHHFLHSKNNWNQVCNASLLAGALSIYEDAPVLAQSIVERSVSSIRLPMQAYGEDGTYAEGYGYWGYGTAFNVILLALLDDCFQSDFGLLSTSPGFLKTPEYAFQMVAPSLQSFNYSDASPTTGLTPSFFWFARQRDDLSLLWMEKRQIERSSGFSYRLLPLVMAWGVGLPFSEMQAPSQRVWASRHRNAVAAMRTSWTAKTPLYVGFKAGTAFASHGHMDVGSFIVEASGVRWAIDLGSQDYHPLESLGLAIWEYDQGSDRWGVYRFNNYAHNTLTLNRQLQQVGGSAVFESMGDDPRFLYVIADLTPVYDLEVQAVKRGVAIVDNSFVVVQDELQAAEKPVHVRSTLLTRAAVQLLSPRNARLTQDGKSLTLWIESPENATLSLRNATGAQVYDEANEGVLQVAVEFSLPPHRRETLCLKLLPDACTEVSAINKQTPRLSEW